MAKARAPADLGRCGEDVEGVLKEVVTSDVEHEVRYKRFLHSRCRLVLYAPTEERKHSSGSGEGARLTVTEQ